MRSLALAALLVCCASPSPTDAPSAPPSRPRAGFQIAPQGGTITGVYGGSGLAGGANGGVVTLSLGACGSGETQVSTGSGYACAAAGGVTSNACSSGWANAIGSDGSLTCSTPTASQVGAVSGSGTTNTIPKWTGSGTIGNSSLTDNGTTVTTSEAAQVHGLTSTASVVVQGNVGATSYLESFTNSSGTIVNNATTGLGTNDLWFQGGASTSTGWISDVGYNAGTTEPRITCVGDGEGSGSGHAIACFDASAHGLYVDPSGTGTGASFTPAGPELTNSSGTIVDSGNFEANGNIQGDSDASIAGELDVTGGANVSGGAVNINTTGTSATSIGNLSGNLTLTGNATTITGSGNTTIDPNGELILDGEFSTVLKAGSGSASIYLEGVLQTTNTGVTAPTISGGTCASNICTNTGGTISFTSNPATLTFTSGFYAHAPICTLGGVPKTASVVISFSSAPSTTSFAVQESTFNSGDKVSYICIGAG